MGYMRHHAIVVTSWDRDLLTKAQQKAMGMFPAVSGIVLSAINDYQSFFVPPDGSKEGWPDSKTGDECRAAFIEWLRSQTYDDGSSALDWVEVQYGDEEGEAMIISHDGDTLPLKTTS